MCPPLFGFASPVDADELESIADDVLGTDDDPRPPRCQSPHIFQPNFQRLTSLQFNLGAILTINAPNINGTEE